ncbi:trans-acting enoyl reductase family protein [Paraconexibacter sp.]|uniref:saccharopine dehydrogenase family protein n=1 Tax=Paraconexibacter sp. TaxID=2949640 RepID=UPI00356B326F
MTPSGRIVLLGATGYTGRLTTAALVAAGATPVLAGRDAAALGALAEASGGLPTAVADITRPGSVRALLEPGDVLVSTVGPFVRYGHAAVESAIDAGCHYLDSTGEPAWVREVFTRYGSQAAERGCALLTAIGYDYVPGNLAGALALERAGGDATRVDVGYYMTGGQPLHRTLSGGTLASLGEAVLEPGFARRGGRIVQERGARTVRRFEVDGRRRSAASIGMSEHFSLPRLHPGLEDVNTYLGWFGSMTRPMQFAAAANAALARVPGVNSGQRALVRRLLRGSRGGPDALARSKTGSYVVAEAFDPRGALLARATLQGANPYEFTGEILAWAAGRAITEVPAAVGAIGPVEAFGLRALERACADIGLEESAQGGPYRRRPGTVPA